MYKLICVAALGASSLGLGGCATVMNGTSQPVEFRSEPTGAEVELVSVEREVWSGEASMVAAHPGGVSGVSAAAHA